MTVTPSSPRSAPLVDQSVVSVATPCGNADLLFDALLKGFDNSFHVNKDGQEAIRPEIGLSADSFLEAALPAHTALPLGSSRFSGDTTDQHAAALDHLSAPALAERALGLLTRVAELLCKGAADEGPTIRPLVTMAAMPTLGQAPVTATQGPPDQAAPPQTVTPQIRFNARIDQSVGLIASLRAAAGKPAPQLPRTETNNPFAAHLLELEGQLRLIVKLPRLSENERQELEGRLRQLFEEFGHNTPELVIRESAGGGRRG